MNETPRDRRLRFQLPSFRFASYRNSICIVRLSVSQTENGHIVCTRVQYSHFFTTTTGLMWYLVVSFCCTFNQMVMLAIDAMRAIDYDDVRIAMHARSSYSFLFVSIQFDSVWCSYRFRKSHTGTCFEYSAARNLWEPFIGFTVHNKNTAWADRHNTRRTNE